MTAFFVVGLVIDVLPAEAALHGYTAQEMITSGKTIELQPGETRDFTIGFKNTGTSVWSNSGNNFVSVYTYDLKYRQSVFVDTSWLRADQPVRVSSLTTPGQLGFFRFKLHAPSTEGNYNETFHLAAEDMTWIPGGQFTLNIRVRRSYVAPASVITTSSTAITPAVAPVNVSHNRNSYSASEVNRSATTLRLMPGERVLFSIDYRNTGQATWLPDGRRFVSIYTYNPKYRKSLFEDATWYRFDQPARIASQITPPGQVGTIKLYLKAPTTPGTYYESFRLAAEDLVWIPGGEFTVTVVVGDSSSAVTSANSSLSSTTTSAPQPEAEPDSEPEVTVAADGYGATMMLTSGSQVKINANAVREFRVAFKNSGILPWVRYGNEPVTLKAVTNNARSFRDFSWSGDSVTSLSQDRTDSGQLAFFTFKLKAPNTGGLYLARFTLHAGDRSIEGGSVEIPVEVTGGSVSASVPYDATSEFSSAGSRGPNIRVGLFKTSSPVIVTAAGSYQLIDGQNHQSIQQLSGVTTVTFNFSTLQYTVTNGAYLYTSNYHVHLRPDNADTTIFEILSYENRAAWDSSLNYNKFRGDLSVHYMQSTGNLWVIEELPIEDYIRGLAETSNGSPQEYQRALVTAARTYALYVISIGGKHKSEYHDVNTTAGDQVYKGYASELVRPNVVQATEATRGSVVTYGGQLVVTPYFSRSDGRTRSWSEVWGGSKPWCTSVPTPYDQGKTLWGHGVGMSASDALGRAAAGTSWTEILRYYYTGTEIKRIY
ncbi:hypothetical protein KKE28_04550 [Patescibacteria group bacterium]|nr:hypothetical protein [Patescibacteria group bacterium]